MRKFLLPILLLIFSCEEPIIEGCTTTTACNYNATATQDDGNCIYAEVNYDCHYNCTSTIDCSNVCGGDAVEDDCGVCDGIYNYVAGSCYDCADTPNGDAVLDECGNCDNNPNNDAVLDECGNCDNNPNNDCVQDCDGYWGGLAVIDDCGNCISQGGEAGWDLHNYAMDECGVCGGDGPEEGFDCMGNCEVEYDCNGVCGGDATDTDSDGVCDWNDGDAYTTVQIGEQLWMSENLKVTRYKNGDEIFTVDGIVGPSEGTQTWNNLSIGAYSDCWSSNHGCPSENANIYGYLYNWYAVDDDRGLCPEGWHVPSYEEWNLLEDYLQGKIDDECTDEFGDLFSDCYYWRIGGMLKSTGTIEDGDGLWKSPNISATNLTGFTALPAGWRYPQASHSMFGIVAYFWSSTPSSFNHYLSPPSSLLVYLVHHQTDLGKAGYSQTVGLSVRCLKDE